MYTEHICNLIDAFACKSPEKIALQDNYNERTYKSLKVRTNYIADFLNKNSQITSSGIVLVLLERSLSLVEVVLSILKSGKVFVPISVNISNERLNEIINLTEAEFLITTSSNFSKYTQVIIDNKSLKTIFIDSDKESTQQFLHLNFNGDFELNTFTALYNKNTYIYFTSGSTGTPKGVIGKHRSLLHFLDWEKNEFGLDHTTKLLQLTNPTFDPYLRDIMVPLLAGGSCIIPVENIIYSPESIINWLENYEITLLHTVPVIFRLISDCINDKEQLTHLSNVLIAGEILRGNDIKKLTEIFGKKIQLTNIYGPTETTLAKFFHRIQLNDIQKSNIPVGLPISYSEAYVLDDNLRKCLLGNIGEVYIRTPFISGGYFKNADLNKKSFIKNPFNNNPNDFIYKTGDLGKIDDDGNLVLHGRNDRQIKLNGIRVDVAEIENNILIAAQVNNVAVVAKSNDGEIKLIAFLLSKEIDNTNELHSQMAKVLPLYSVPSEFILVDEFPLNRNGKVDYNKLADLVSVNQTVKGRKITTKTEMKLADIWFSILGSDISHIFKDSNFFALGGNSLKIMRLAAEIKSVFDHEISLSEIFNNICLEDMAKVIENSFKQLNKDFIILEKLDYYPCSAIQKRLFVLNKLVQDVTYNIPITIIIDHELDKEKVISVIQQLVERHENLRSSFHHIYQSVFIKVHPEAEVDVREYFLANEDIRAVNEDFVKPFDLEKCPLFRVGLVINENKIHSVLFDAHHIIADAISMQILIEEFQTLLRGETLQPIKFHYKEYAYWQNNTIEGLHKQKEYWLKKFEDGIPILDLPADFNRPLFQSFEGETLYFKINKTLSGKLKKYARNKDSTLFMLLLGYYNILLSKLSGQEKIIVGTPISERTHADLSKMVGPLLNEIVLINSPNGNKRLAEFLEEVRINTINDFEHKSYPFDQLVDKLQIDRSTNRNPLYNVYFVMYDTVGETDSSLKSRKKVHNKDKYENKTSKFDFGLSIIESETLECSITYCTKIFTKASILRFIEYFIQLITTCIDQPNKLIAEIDLLPDKEKSLILNDFNDTQLDKVFKGTIHSLFEKQAAERPDATALVFKDQIYTYAEVNKKANIVAEFLINKLNVSKGELIGIYIQRSPEMVLAMLATLKAGCTYVALDCNWPVERLSIVLNNTCLETVITCSQKLSIIQQIKWKHKKIKNIICPEGQKQDDLVEQVETHKIETYWDYVAGNANDLVEAGNFYSSFTGEKFKLDEVERYRNYIFSILDPYILEYKTVLEIGCGTGLIAQLILQRDVKYIGVDPSIESIEYAKHLLKASKYDNIQFIKGYAHEIKDLISEKVDVVILSSVVQFFPGLNYLNKILGSILEMLNDNGIILLADLLDLDQKELFESNLVEGGGNTKEILKRTNNNLYLSKDYIKSYELSDGLIVNILGRSEKEFNSELRYRFDALIIKKKLPNGLNGILNVDNIITQCDFKTEEIDNPQVSVDGGDNAYVIYTSGSTGIPKGVLVKHEKVLNLIDWVNHKFSVSENDRLLFITSISFDLSVYDVFGILAAGGAIHIANEEEIKDPDQLVEIMDTSNITIWDSAPAAMLQLMPYIKSRNTGVKSLKTIFLSGDWIPLNLAEELKEYLHHARLICLGGATEATIWSNYFEFHHIQDEWNSIPYGKPIQNAKYLIFDNSMNLSPIGVAGQLFIGGNCLASGYLNDIEQSNERFIANPVEMPGCETIYNTGDKVRWFPDGNIEFLGRYDNQVKVRGYRIELTEIENQLKSFKNIRDVIIVTQKEQNNIVSLLSFYTSEEEYDDNEIRDFLLRKLPDYMIPSSFHYTKQFPLTLNGKIDYKELVSLANKRIIDKNSKPTSKIEIELANIWSSLLKVEKVSIGNNSDFFKLGGHSLNATSLVSEIQRVFNKKINLLEVFNHSTIEKLAKLIESAQLSEKPVLAHAESKEFYIASPQQKRLFVIQSLNKNQVAYNISQVIRLEQNPDVNKVKASFQKMIRRHESLRTNYTQIGYEVFQKISDEVTFDIEIIESTSLQDTVSDFIRPFDLQNTPLFRIGVINNNPTNEHFIIIDLHHIICDGLSITLLEKEFVQLYDNQEVAVLEFQYKDYSNHYYSTRKLDSYNSQKQYWLKEFEGELPLLRLPADLSRPVLRSTEGKSVEFELDAKQLISFQKIASENKTSLFSVMLTSYFVFLNKITQQKDIIIGIPVDGRRRREFKNVIGFFVNLIPVRCVFQSDNPFLTLLKNTHEKLLLGIDNQDFPFEELINEIQVPREPGRHPLLDVMLVTQGLDEEGASDNFEQDNIIDSNKSKVDLTVTITRYEGKLSCKMLFSGDLFSDENIHVLSSSFNNVLLSVSRNPFQKIKEIELVDTIYKEQLFSENTKVRKPYHKNYYGWFEETVKANKTSTALVKDEISISYAELENEICNKAITLEKQGVKKGQIVVVKAKPSLELIYNMMAIFKLGAVYLPVDDDIKKSRLNVILNDIKEGFLLDGDAVQPFVQTINKTKETISSEKKESQLDDVAYIIYTSGTTGTPKGVCITQENITNYLHWFISFAEISNNDKAITSSSFAFDAVYTQVLSTLVRGGELHLIGKETLLSPDLFISYVFSNEISYLKLTPSLFNVLVSDNQMGKVALPKLRFIMLGGEKINVNDIIKAHSFYPNIKFINHYGPTETTIGSLAQYIDFNDIEGYKQAPTIGKPIYNTQVFILDEAGCLLPENIPGELCITGMGVGKGYLNNIELTTKKFNTSFLKGEQVVYKTGDIAKLKPNGTYEIIDRIDRQVKVNGYRIELGEIEANLKNYELISDAVVVLKKNKKAESIICGYFTSGQKIELDKLRKYLKAVLPSYFLPSFLIQLEKLPFTSHNKILYSKLPDPDITKESDSSLLRPNTEIEQKVELFWKEILGDNSYNIKINFFDVGGSSISLIKLNQLINNTFNINMSVIELFKYTSIETQSSAIEESLNNEVPFVEEKKQISTDKVRKNQLLQRELRKN